MKDNLSDSIARALRYGFTVRFTPHENQCFGVNIQGKLNNGAVITNSRRFSDLELSTTRLDMFTGTVDQLLLDTLTEIQTRHPQTKLEAESGQEKTKP